MYFVLLTLNLLSTCCDAFHNSDRAAQECHGLFDVHLEEIYRETFEVAYELASSKYYFFNFNINILASLLKIRYIVYFEI